MEAGLLPYGDSAGILDMIRQMRDGTVLGRELAEGRNASASDTGAAHPCRQASGAGGL